MTTLAALTAASHRFVAPSLSRRRERRARGRRPRAPATTRALFGGKNDDDKNAYPSSVRAPLPLPEAIATGLRCALDGAKVAIASPSEAWKPLTAATLTAALALDGAGFYAASAWLAPGDDAGAVRALASKVLLVAVDGAWVFVAPLIAIAIVQQVLPLLGEKILFDALRATAGMPSAIVSDEDDDVDDDCDASSSSSSSSSSSAFVVHPGRRARVEQLEASPGLGIRGLGVAASRAQSLASLTALVAPLGVGVSFVPVGGPIVATARSAHTLVPIRPRRRGERRFLRTLLPGVSLRPGSLGFNPRPRRLSTPLLTPFNSTQALTAAVAAYALAWELLDPYFDKAQVGLEQQERVVWDNRAALICFAAPFAAGLAIPVVGPFGTAVAQARSISHWSPYDRVGVVNAVS